LAKALAVLKIELLLDVRENPISRRADCRSSELAKVCAGVGLSYESWTALGLHRPNVRGSIARAI